METCLFPPHDVVDGDTNVRIDKLTGRDWAFPSQIDIFDLRHFMYEKQDINHTLKVAYTNNKTYILFQLFFVTFIMIYDSNND